MRTYLKLPVFILLMLMSLALSVATTQAREPQAGPAKDPGLLTVDFRVLGASGAPILDLKPGDVTLKVDGRVREIRALELVQTGSGQSAADGTPVPALPPPYASNGLADSGRIVYVVLEDESIPTGREQNVRDTVNAVLGTLSGRDRVGLLVTSRAAFDVALTNRYDAVQTSLAKFVGRAARAETADEAACRTLQALDYVKGLVGTLAGGPPATVVMVSGGLAAPVFSGATVRRQNTTSAAAGGASCDLRRELFDELTAAALRASVELYVAQIPTDAAVGAASANDATAGLEHMGGLTGNALLRATANMKNELAKVAKENSAYYLASFETDASDRAGTSPRVEVRVGRPDAKVKSRSEVAIPKGAAAAGAAKTAFDLLKVATVFRDVPLRAVAQSTKTPTGNDIALLVMFEPFDRSLVFSSAAVGLFDAKGKLVAPWTAQPAELQAIPFMAGMTVKPGLYRMRVAVTDVFGRPGTVDQNIRVELDKGEAPVEMSTMVLGAPLNGALGLKLLYTAEPSALVYVEIYGASQTGTVTAAIELAATSAGPALVSAPAKVGTPAKDGRRKALGEIPIASLRPGEYVVRFIVSVDGKPVGRIERTLRKALQ